MCQGYIILIIVFEYYCKGVTILNIALLLICLLVCCLYCVYVFLGLENEITAVGDPPH
jgi:hypothetical protein